MLGRVERIVVSVFRVAVVRNLIGRSMILLMVALLTVQMSAWLRARKNCRSVVMWLYSILRGLP